MSRASGRLALVRSLLAGRGLLVTDVGHSVGSTINIGAGRTSPRRYSPFRQGRRRPGFYRKAAYDLFLASANWELSGKTGYKLSCNDDARRIAKECRKLLGSRIRSVDVAGFRDRVRFVFRDGTSLIVWPDKEDRDFGWTVQMHGRHFCLGDSA